MADKVLFFDCSSGVSSDMLLGALVGVGADLEHIKSEASKLVSTHFNITADHITKSSIGGVDLNVILYNMPLHDHDYYDNGASGERERSPIHDHDHDFMLPDGGKHRHDTGIGDRHTSYHAIRHMIEGSELSGDVKQRMSDIYSVIAEAEAGVHGTSKDEVIFHEVGRTEQIITIAAICIAVESLGVKKIFTSAVHDGSGQIVAAHGIIPVPVPAVMEILKKSDIPLVIEADVTTEMVTPSGLGILEGLGAKYEQRLGILPERTGYGFGKRDTGRFGAVRAIIGEEQSI
jgi:uncharacterized protein (DUF111 family)